MPPNKYRISGRAEKLTLELDILHRWACVNENTLEFMRIQGKNTLFLISIEFLGFFSEFMTEFSDFLLFFALFFYLFDLFKP